jgi:hypothetical protein
MTTLQSELVRAIRMRGLPDGMHCHHAGSIDDTDYNNVHIAISWP